ncbi:MAG: hydrogenase maturation protease [Desulfobacter sp.]|nr:hydrogenase maturation protease [Desulfobacter sp.]WDP87523.1 MAG: hydrogenase maturation protease [Desulfobacter sp.]
MKHSTVVCGIGNPMLKDDRAGIEIAERVEQNHLPVDTQVIFGVGFEVNDKIMGYDRAIIIDAAKTGASPGTIHEVTIDDIFESHRLVVSHAITLGSTLKVGYELFPDEMPEQLTIFLIEAEDYAEFTKICSPSVQDALDRVYQMIQESVEGAPQ